MNKDKAESSMSKLRTKKDLTQRQVADALGVTVQTVSNWETGYREPRLTFQQVVALCRLMNCTFEELTHELGIN